MAINSTAPPTGHGTLTAPATAQYFSVLTGIRAIAAYMVFLSHDNPFNSDGPRSGLHAGVFGMFSALSIGVSVFFVLSGFLITVRYERNIELS